MLKRQTHCGDKAKHFYSIIIIVTTIFTLISLPQVLFIGSAVCLTQDQRVVASSLTSITALCPRAGHINPCLGLVQPSKTRPDVAERLFTGT